jgi:hypothetical protein
MSPKKKTHTPSVAPVTQELAANKDHSPSQAVIAKLNRKTPE